MNGVDGLLAEARRRTRRETSIAWILAVVLLLMLAGVLSAAGVLPAVAAGSTTGVSTTGEPVDRAVAPASGGGSQSCLLYTSPSPRDVEESRMPSSA